MLSLPYFLLAFNSFDEFWPDGIDLAVPSKTILLPSLTENQPHTLVSLKPMVKVNIYYMKIDYTTNIVKSLNKYIKININVAENRCRLVECAPPILTQSHLTKLMLELVPIDN